MTKGQRIALQADWWPNACRAQGWKSSDRDLRMRVCMWAVSLENPSQKTLLDAIQSDRTPLRRLESTNDLNSREDVDNVKACLGMLADKMKETGEVGQPQFGSARRKRDVIRTHLKCLALYHSSPRKLLATLVGDMMERYRSPGGPPLTIRDLTDDVQIYMDRKTRQPKEGPSQLDRLMMRFAQIVNDARNKNELLPAYAHLQSTQPLTGHEMKLTAKVPCDCAVCCKLAARGLLAQLPYIPPLQENWADFDPELESITNEIEGGGGETGDNPF